MDLNCEAIKEKTLVCTFCGHHDAKVELKPMLRSVIEKLITDKGVNGFYVGNHGSFDYMAADILHTLKEQYPHIRAYIVLAYMPGKKEEYPIDNKLDTIYPDGLETIPRRYAITHRNRWMIANSDILISGVNHGWGGAAETLKYAKGRGLEIIDVSENK